MNEIRSFTILSADQAWELFGDLATEAFLRDMRGVLPLDAQTYQKPTLPPERQILADYLAELLTTTGSGILRITNWWDETAPFDEYRMSLGETRRLKDASIHLFSGDHRLEVRHLLSFVLDLDWDCFVFNKTFQYLIQISHDGYINFASADLDFSTRARTYFALAKLKPFPKQVFTLDK